MNTICNYLLSLRNDVFKLLPMKESELQGAENHLNAYIERILFCASGALKTFPILTTKTEYIRVLNMLEYLYEHQGICFKSWRKNILDLTRVINDLHIDLDGGGQ